MKGMVQNLLSVI